MESFVKRVSYIKIYHVLNDIKTIHQHQNLVALIPAMVSFYNKR